MNSKIIIYTDGACKRNGRPDASAGIGIWFGDGDSRNVSAKIPGKQTNQRAELLAAIGALQALEPGDVAEIRSDSKYVIKGITEWIHNWKRKMWNVAVVNLDLWQMLDSLNQNLNVTWTYVPAHSGIYGNECADRLASAAC